MKTAHLETVLTFWLAVIFTSVSAQAQTVSFVSQWGGMGSGDGQMSYLGRVAVDSSGNVYVSDSSNHRIQKFDRSGNYLSQWGSEGNGEGQFNYPSGIAVDSSGNVFVGDGGNNRVQKFDSSGRFLLQWGTLGSAPGQFDFPSGIALDARGDVYVVDAANNRIQKFNSVGSYLMHWGSMGTGDGQFDYPIDVTVDRSGNVYVTEASNNRIQKFDKDGRYVTRWGSFGQGNSQFDAPDGIATDASGNVYVVDANNYRVQVFDGTGRYISQWGSQGTGNGQFDLPSGIAIDHMGTIVIADGSNCRVQQFRSNNPALVRSAPPSAAPPMVRTTSPDFPIETGGEVFSGHDTLGHGINLLASKTSSPIRERLINDSDSALLDTDIGKVPAFVTVQGKSKTTSNRTTASSYSSLERQLRVGASTSVDYLGFSGSVEANYSSTVRNASTAYVAHASVSASRYKVELRPEDPGRLKYQLDESFKQDLNDRQLSPEKLFERYGTHMVTKILLGGRLDFWYESTATESMSKTDFEMVVKASYGPVSGSGSLGKTQIAESKKRQVEERIQAQGGSADASALVGDSKVSVAEWAASLTQKELTYIGRPERDLVALWELCEDPNGERARSLEREFRHQRAKYKLENAVVFSQSWNPSPGKEDQVPGVQDRTLEIPEGYKILSGGAEVRKWNVPGSEKSGYHLFTSSFPDTDRHWRARSECHARGDFQGWDREAVMVISVLAIYDPEDDWTVNISGRKVPQGNGYSEGTSSPSSGTLTGGGAEITNRTGWSPLITASNPQQLGNSYVWHARCQYWLELGRGDLEIFSISIAPASGVDWKLTPRVKEHSGSVGPSSSDHVTFGDDVIFVGGGVVSNVTGKHFPFASLPRTLPNTEGTEWFGRTAIYYTPGNAAVKVQAIGVTLNEVAY